MSDDNIIDLKDATRDLKDRLNDRWQTEHTHFMDLMNAIIPAMNLVGEPMISIGWQHIVARAQQWRKMLAQQQTVLEVALTALDQNMTPDEVKTLLNIQRQQLDATLNMWEPVPKIPAEGGRPDAV